MTEDSATKSPRNRTACFSAQQVHKRKQIECGIAYCTVPPLPTRLITCQSMSHVKQISEYNYRSLRSLLRSNDQFRFVFTQSPDSSPPAHDMIAYRLSIVKSSSRSYTTPALHDSTGKI